MQGFKEILGRVMLDTSPQSVLPLWRAGRDGKPSVAGFRYHILNMAKQELQREKDSVTEGISKLRERVDSLKEHIRSLQEAPLEDHVMVLQAEVDSNREILETLIAEQESYLPYLSELSKSSKNNEDSSVIADINALLKEFIPPHVKMNTESLRRYKIQLSALIKPDTMTPEEIKNVIDQKADVLGRDLGITEAEIEKHRCRLSEISDKIAEIDSITPKKL